MYEILVFHDVNTRSIYLYKYMRDKKFYFDRNYVILSIILNIYNYLYTSIYFLYLLKIKLIYS